MEVKKIKLDEAEFMSFCLEVSRVAGKYGIDSDLISIILAEAIKNRENALRTNKASVNQRTTTIRERVSEARQPIYAPPSFRR